MAYIGLRKPIIGKMETEGTYGEPFALGKAIGLQVTPNYAEGSLFADDVQAEYDKAFSFAEVTLNTSTIPIQAHKEMFGHTVSEESEKKSVDYDVDDQNNYVGMGWITQEIVSGVRSFTGNFLYKVKFSEPSEDYATKGENIEYKTPTISGRAMANDDGKWKSVEVFKTEKEAMDWINTKFGKVAAAETKKRAKEQ